MSHKEYSSTKIIVKNNSIDYLEVLKRYKNNNELNYKLEFIAEILLPQLHKPLNLNK